MLNFTPKKPGETASPNYLSDVPDGYKQTNVGSKPEVDVPVNVDRTDPLIPQKHLIPEYVLPNAKLWRTTLPHRMP